MDGSDLELQARLVVRISYKLTCFITQYLNIPPTDTAAGLARKGLKDEKLLDV